MSGSLYNTSQTQQLNTLTVSVNAIEEVVQTQTNYIEMKNVVSVPSNPSDGFGRLYKKVGDDKLYWKADSGGPEYNLTDTGLDTGENNTGSNQGADGVGVFDTKSGVDLQFRHVAPASTKVSVVLNGKDIDLDVVEANIDHDALNNYVANEHIDWTVDQSPTEINASNLPDLPASAITSGTFADARISQSSVTQHEGAITHNNLTGLTTGDPHTQYIKADGTRAFSGDQSMGNNKLTNLAQPTNPLDASTKAYTDGIATGLDFKASVRVKTDSAFPAYTATGSMNTKLLTADANGALPTIDGVTLVNGDRLLVTTEATTTDVDNGIYVVDAIGDGSNPWVLSRAEDADGVDPSSEVTSGMFCFIEEGTLSADSGYVMSTNDPITVDTTPLTFVKFSGGITDHGALGGLGDDDHTQYLLVNGTRAMGGNLNMDQNLITNCVQISNGAGTLNMGDVQTLTTTTTGAINTPGAGNFTIKNNAVVKAYFDSNGTRFDDVVNMNGNILYGDDAGAGNLTLASNSVANDGAVIIRTGGTEQCRIDSGGIEMASNKDIDMNSGDILRSGPINFNTGGTYNVASGFSHNFNINAVNKLSLQNTKNVSAVPIQIAVGNEPVSAGASFGIMYAKTGEAHNLYYLGGSGASSVEKLMTNVYGTEYNYLSSVGPFTTSSLTLFTATSYTTPILVNGAKYELMWRYGFENTVADKTAVSEVFNFTDTQVIGNHEWIHKNDGGTGRESVSGFIEVTGSGAPKTFQIKHRIRSSGTSSVTNVRWRIIRIS